MQHKSSKKLDKNERETVRAAPTHSHHFHRLVTQESRQEDNFSNDSNLRFDLNSELNDSVRRTFTRLENDPRFSNEIELIRDIVRRYEVSESYILFGEETLRRFDGVSTQNSTHHNSFVRRTDTDKVYMVDSVDRKGKKNGKTKLIHENMLFLAYTKCDMCNYDPKQYIKKPELFEVRQKNIGIAEESLLYFVKLQMIMGDHANETGHTLHGNLFFPSKFVKITPSFYFRLKKSIFDFVGKIFFE